MTHSDDAIRYRDIAARERARADAEPLVNARAVLLRSAERWDKLAAHAERVASGRC